ncbi:GNAT family N-acetyltransferase [Halostagnicola kamekurae]|uniref:Acetyltransferase (GNAT) family protein n=1 Tax=Halostagnicola kamekurae TaxID=619731 RepID=A0A1I6SD23_9EURY|nr:GNAT family N-acetyltransferase [Halostagnicola kamekurae]SFS74813.1 Acetyltransferase (GNAT) family protein [Halostagnicola kamekurae]
MELELLGWPPDGPKLRLDHERFSYAGKFVMTNTGKAVARADDGRTDARATGNDGEKTDDRARASESVARAVDSDGRAPDYDDDVLAAASFNEDRTDAETLWIRYVTVAKPRRGNGIGPKLLAFVRDRATDRGYARVRIAVNNPFAYEALYRAGFAFTGETTGLAELVLEHSPAEDRPTSVSASDESGIETRIEDETPVDESERRDAARYRDGLERFRERELSDPEEEFLSERLD